MKLLLRSASDLPATFEVSIHLLNSQYIFNSPYVTIRLFSLLDKDSFIDVILQSLKKRYILKTQLFIAVTTLNKGCLYNISTFCYFKKNTLTNSVFLTFDVDVMDGLWVNDIIWRKSWLHPWRLLINIYCVQTHLYSYFPGFICHWTFPRAPPKNHRLFLYIEQVAMNRVPFSFPSTMWNIFSDGQRV